MLRQAQDRPRPIRQIALVFAMLAMLLVAVASASPAHTHLNSAADRCDICSAAHMAAQQVATVQVFHSLEIRNFIAAPEAVQRVESRSVLALVTRGPPASL